MNNQIVSQRVHSSSPPSPKTVRDLLPRRPEIAWIDDSSVAVAAKMRASHLAILPVLDDDRQPVGLITHRDIVLRVVATARHPEEIAAREIMTPGAISCVGDLPLGEAIRLMKKCQVTALMVLDSITSEVLGAISLDAIGSHKIVPSTEPQEEPSRDVVVGPGLSARSVR